MTGRLRTSAVGLELIKSFEGFRETAARLPDGRWTIKTWVKPFIDWIWAGCFMMAIGGFIAISDRRYRASRATEAASRRVGAAA